MTSQTRYNMTVGSFIRTLKKNGITVADEKNKGGNYDLTKDGKIVGELTHMGDGTPYIRSFCKKEPITSVEWNNDKQSYEKVTTEIDKHYYSAAGFIRYGIK